MSEAVARSLNPRNRSADRSLFDHLVEFVRVVGEHMPTDVKFRYYSSSGPNGIKGETLLHVAAETEGVQAFFRKVGAFASGHPVRQAAEAIGELTVVPRDAKRNTPAIGRVSELIS